MPETKPSSGILRLAAPLILSFWMRSLFSFVDTIYASTMGDSAVAAVGLSVPLEFLMIACWVGVSTGLTSTLSRAMGAREDTSIARLLAAARHMVYALVPFFTAIGGAVWLAAPRMGLEPETARNFGIYTSVLVAGSAFTSYWSIIPDSIVKAHHDTKSTMWAGIWSNVINLVLNTIFTFVFHWGVFGIALSTVLGRFGGLAYALRRAAALEAARRSDGVPSSPARVDRPHRAILGLAIPAAATYGLMATESSIINALLANLEHATEAIAAYAIYFRVMLFCVMPIVATSVAMLPYVARKFGENDLAGIEHGLREASVAAGAYCVVVVAPALILGGPAIAAALAESAITAQFTTSALWACPLVCLFGIPFFLVRPAFEGMQRGAPGLIMALVRYVVLTAPLSWAGMETALALGHSGFIGLVGGQIVATALTSVAFLAWMRAALDTMEREKSTAVPAHVASSPEELESETEPHL